MIIPRCFVTCDLEASPMRLKTASYTAAIVITSSPLNPHVLLKLPSWPCQATPAAQTKTGICVDGAVA